MYDRFGPATSLWTLSPRPQQRPIAPIHHLPRIAQEGHHRVALGGTLPFVAAHWGQAVQNLRDLAVGGAGFAPVIGAQHELGAAQALVGQAVVGGHFPAMYPGEEAIHRLEPREAVRVERDDGGIRNAFRRGQQQLQPVPFAGLKEHVDSVSGLGLHCPGHVR